MIPNPLDLITDAAGAAAGWSWEQVADGIARWVLGAIAEMINGVLNFLKTTTRPDVTDAWFSGNGSPYAAVRNVSAVLLIGFLLAGIIQGLVAGDTSGMIRRVGVDAPVAVLGMIATTAAKGVLRRLIELMLAVIVSKLVISIALAVGVAALGGAGSAAGPEPGVGEWAAQGLGTLVVGTSILCLAAFSPFVVLKLIPVAEAAVVAQGVSRSPMNTARSGMNTAYYARSLGRLGGRSGGSGSAPEPPADASPPPFGPPGLGGDPGGGGPPGGGGSPGGGGPAGSAGTAAGSGTGAAGAGSSAAASSAGSSGASGAGAGAGASAGAAAAAGPAVAVVPVAEGAKAAKSAAEGVGHQVASAVDAGTPDAGQNGWQRVPNEPPARDFSEPLPRDEP
ncbi:MAG: hypothetical protein IPG46_06500 [Actinobacteria bacterium]|nr:hypothetical protein [Actinomycetota bacterium]